MTICSFFVNPLTPPHEIFFLPGLSHFSTNVLKKDIKLIKKTYFLTLLWYHGVNMSPGLFDRLNIPNNKIVSITLPFYFFTVLVNYFHLCNFHFNVAFVVDFRFNLTGVILIPWYHLG